MAEPGVAKAAWKWRRRAKWLLLPPAAALVGVASFLLLDWMYPFPRERIRDALATQSPMVHSADGSLLSWTVDAEENWRLPVRLSDVSPHLVKATVAVEDKRFYSHPGVDLVAATRAAWQNLSGGRRISGASTLTMQTVRLLWQRPRRWDSKIVEAFRAVQLERLAGKEDILELYFNLAPYGGNVVGAEAAARRYFGKSCANLSLGEASLLAGVPQSPSRLDPRRRPDAARKRRLQVLDRMAVDGMIGEKDAAAAAEEDIVARAVRPRDQSSHFSRLVKSGSVQWRGAIETTLVPDRQDQAERLVAEWARATPGISGPALVVMRVADGAVVAYVGNGGERSGPDWQVDAARMRRQAGSLLKPFLFAGLAERGAITPSSMVMDTPGFWPDYAPENMDREWRGEISASAALSESRNLPAVRQLSRLGTDGFADMLHTLGLDAGVPSRQGLAMALGVREQDLLSLVNAYAALARLGEWQPVKVLRQDDDEGERRRAWSAEAAWLTLAALAKAPGRDQPSLAWKTGTSWNGRDAWAVALTPEWVVGVWCGRMRNGGGTWVSGGVNALPLALAALTAASGGRETAWPVPEGIEYERMCAASGQMPGWHCAELIESPFSRRHPPAGVCGRCGPDGTPFAQFNGTTGAAVPVSQPLQIAEPRPGAIYVVPDVADGVGDAVSIFFKTVSAGRNGKLYWFLDGELLSVAESGEGVPWTATKGGHRVVVVDAMGAQASAVFSVVGMESLRNQR